MDRLETGAIDVSHSRPSDSANGGNTLGVMSDEFLVAVLYGARSILDFEIQLVQRSQSINERGQRGVLLAVNVTLLGRRASK